MPNLPLHGARLRIQNESGRGQTTKVWLNDQEISKYIRKLEVNVDCVSAIQVCITFVVGILDMDVKGLIDTLGPDRLLVIQTANQDDTDTLLERTRHAN